MVFVEVDVDSLEGSKIADEYGIYAIPTLYVIGRDGRIVYRHVGVVSYSELSSILDEMVG